MSRIQFVVDHNILGMSHDSIAHHTNHNFPLTLSVLLGGFLDVHQACHNYISNRVVTARKSYLHAIPRHPNRVSV